MEGAKDWNEILAQRGVHEMGESLYLKLLM